LENDNDNVRTKGQQQPGFSQALSSAREEVTAQQTTEQTAAQLPLADGIKPEQFTAEQQMKRTALDTPIKAENLFDEMVSRLETMQTEQTRTMTIHLRPEFLGKVAMELAMDAAGLHVKINAADAGVRAMINSQVTALIESLENKGIEVVEVEVAYTGVDNGAFKDKRDDTSQSNNKRRLRREINAADGVAYYTVQQYESSEYYLEAGVSSVEYSA
jgi:flagellar hook-length control protein FliK